MAIDGNVRYEKDENGDYLTVRSTSLLDIVSPSFISNNITLLQSQTGAAIFVPTTGADSTITLPTAKKGLQYSLVCAADNGAHTITIAGTFKGSVLSASSVATATGSDLVIAASKFKIGDKINLICDGTNWLVSGQLLTATAVSVS
jgi:hypothetical protein